MLINLERVEQMSASGIVGATRDRMRRIVLKHGPDGRLRRAIRKLAYLAIALLVCANLGLSIYGGLEYWWRVPFWDMIATFWDYFHLPYWKFLIKPDNEHVQIVGKALYALDFNVFHATGAFLIISTWASIAVSAWAIASAAQHGAPPDRKRFLFWGFFGLSLVLFLWLVNADNLLWPHQVILYSSVCFFLLSTRLYTRWGEYRPNSIEAATAIGLTCLSVLSFGFGVAGALTMLVIMLLQRTPWRLNLLTGLCLGAAIVVYFWLLLRLLGRPLGTGGMTPFQALTHVHAIFAFLIVFLSAPVLEMLKPVMAAATAGMISELASTVGLFAGGLLLLSAWRRSIESAAASFALSLVVYGMGNGLVTALGRLALGPEYALNSRYFVIPTLFWIGLAAVGVTESRFRPERWNTALVGAALSVLSLIAVWQVHWLKAPNLPPAETGETEMALINDVETHDYLDRIWGGPEPWTRDVVGELRKRNWSIFHQPIAHVIGKSGFAVLGGKATGCVGAVNDARSVPEMPDAIRIYGWAYDMQTRSHVQDIVFLGPDNMIRGVGRTMSGRDDVNEARPEITDPLTGWLGFYRPNGIPANNIDAYAVVQRSGHMALCKLPR